MPDWLIVGVNFGNGAKILCHGIIKAMMAADLGALAFAQNIVQSSHSFGFVFNPGIDDAAVDVFFETDGI